MFLNFDFIFYLSKFHDFQVLHIFVTPFVTISICYVTGELFCLSRTVKIPLQYKFPET